MKRLAAGVSVLLGTVLTGASGPSGWDRDIRAVVMQGKDTTAGRAAWQRLSEAGPDALLPLLDAMTGTDTVAANWLRTAFDAVADRALKTNPTQIDAVGLLAHVRDPRKPGRARRLALDLVETVRSGTREKLYAGWLHDPEFRFEAVARVLGAAQAAQKAKAVAQADKLLHEAFAAARDQQQVRDVAAGLAQLGITVSVARQMGFLTDWYVIGPFDGKGKQGFRLDYPPQQKVDLAETLPGQNGMVRWKRYQVREPNPTARGGHQALVNLRDKSALGDADDAVAFAYTAFTIPAAIEAEFRGAADDNLTVWVNGVHAFGFEEWRNGVRLDRHRFKVALKAGENTVLVKVCQTPVPNPEPNWEFFLRVVDGTGKGIAMQNALPKS